MRLPLKFENILKENQTIYSIVLDVIASFEPILNDNKLFFFEEYTDHGINHIEKVLESAEFIITDASYDNISSAEIAILTLSVILHDLGMHVELSTFNSLLSGEYDSCKADVIDKRTWLELWDEYLSEVKRFNAVQKMNVFGDESIPFKIPDLSNRDNLTGYDKKLIGEFIRRHHGRFAHEVALLGLKGEGGKIEFGTNKLEPYMKKLVGILARSHSMNVRDTFGYLEEFAHNSWRNPHGINIIYLMIILRIADYIQIDRNRVNSFLLKLKTFNSPISKIEHQGHLSINSLNFNNVDNENIYVDCNPENSEMFVKIKNLITDIQNELDKSWAILGEVYGFIPNNRPSLKFRRISSNLENKVYQNQLNFLPEKITFKVDNNLSKLLVSPLYGDNPTFGVRELLQNSIDACFERKEIEYQKKIFTYVPLIEVSINRVNEQQSVFTIRDNGKGMTSDEIINYFLSVGNSFRKSMDWKKKFVDEQGKTRINRNGRFGIGVLASFLLGKEISVETKSISNNECYSFTASIDTQFINITKYQSDADFGTTISVVIDNQNRDRLIKHKPNWWDKSVKWTNWYLFDNPKVVFSVDKDIVNGRRIIDGVKFFEFKTEDFEKISWSYDLQVRGHNTNLIACNGIIITERYDSSTFVYLKNEEKEISYGNLITNKPSILLIDKEGIFPVKLDRNEIDCVELPFEKELLEETGKHFIAQLLNTEVSKGAYRDVNIIHNPNLLYGNDGFIVNSDYFINGVKEEYSFVRIITENDKLEINLEKYKTSLFDFRFSNRIHLSYQEMNVAPRFGGRILLPRTKFDPLFKGNRKRLNRYVTNNIDIVESTEKYIIYSIYGFNDNPVVLINIGNLDASLLTQVESIQEVSSKEFGVDSGEVLSELFKKYIKRNYIIPYDMKGRKKLYKEAFEELEYYMK